MAFFKRAISCKSWWLRTELESRFPRTTCAETCRANDDLQRLILVDMAYWTLAGWKHVVKELTLVKAFLGIRRNSEKGWLHLVDLLCPNLLENVEGLYANIVSLDGFVRASASLLITFDMGLGRAIFDVRVHSRKGFTWSVEILRSAQTFPFSSPPRNEKTMHR